MNVNALARETDIPISDTKSLATAFTGPNTASNVVFIPLPFLPS